MKRHDSARSNARWLFSAVIGGLFILVIAPAVRSENADVATDSYYSANGLYNRKLYDLAAEEYKSFLSKYPSHEKALHAQLGLALCLFNVGKHNEAEPMLAKLAGNDKAPEQGQVHLLWGQCLLALDRPEDARKSFQWGVDNAADASAKENSLAGLIEALFRQQKWLDVVTRTDELLKIAPKGQFATRARFQGGLARYELKQVRGGRRRSELTDRDAKGTPFEQQTHLPARRMQTRTRRPRQRGDRI